MWISIHVPREGDDMYVVACNLPSRIFQSTSPARGTTRADRVYGRPAQKYFNPRPPRGGRLNNQPHEMTLGEISIHVPREGDDKSCIPMPRTCGNFNPRPPRGGRPSTSRTSTPSSSNFNPRPPRGGRLWRLFCGHPETIFQSTSPARGRPVIVRQISK